MNRQNEDDECDVFGIHVAKQLKKLSEEECIHAQQEIQNILTRCRLRDLKPKTPSSSTFTRISSSNSHSPHYSTSSYASSSPQYYNNTESTEERRDSENITPQNQNYIDLVYAAIGEGPIDKN